MKYFWIIIGIMATAGINIFWGFRIIKKRQNWGRILLAESSDCRQCDYWRNGCGLW